MQRTESEDADSYGNGKKEKQPPLNLTLLIPPNLSIYSDL